MRQVGYYEEFLSLDLRTRVQERILYEIRGLPVVLFTLELARRRIIELAATNKIIASDT